MADPSPQGPAKLMRVLLAVVGVTLPVSLGLAGYVALRSAEIEGLRAKLLSEADLQQSLLSSQDSDKAVTPHINREIGYVLNTGMKESTWHGAEGASYRINALGLRGPEIQEKRPGVKRILVVGDSVLFGWKLEDGAIVANVMQSIVDERLGKGRFEFVNVALPGWNVRSERAFLDSHINRLQPDYVVWSIIRNDIFTTPGVVPPGMLEASTSSQKRAQVPFHDSGAFYHRNLPVPTIVDEWRRNVRLIKSFGERHEVGILMLYWRPGSRYLFDRARLEEGFGAPVVMVPDSLREDERWQVSEGDAHPTPWATERLAHGLLDRLVREGEIPAFERSESEVEIAARFESAEVRQPSPEEIDERARALFSLVPTEYVHPKTYQAGIYGEHKGELLKNGVLVLRDPGESSALRLDLDVPNPGVAYPMEVSFRIRNHLGEERRVTRGLTPGLTRVALPLPERAGGDLAVYEVAWEFNYSFCRSRRLCPSATLRAGHFVE